MIEILCNEYSCSLLFEFLSAQLSEVTVRRKHETFSSLAVPPVLFELDEKFADARAIFHCCVGSEN